MRQAFPNSERTIWLQVLIAAIMSTFCLQWTIAQERTNDQIFVEGLRARRLFELAEKQIDLRLTSKGLSKTDQGNLIIERLRTHTAAAIQTPQAQRAEKWQATFAVGEDFINLNPNHPRKILIQLQTELARLAEGKLLAQQLIAGIAEENVRAVAVEKINIARRGLERVELAVEQAMPQALNSSSDPDVLAPEHLRALQKNVQYQIAYCNLQTARLYSVDDRLNRVDSLTQVVRRLEEVAAQTNQGTPLWWKTEMNHIEALRLLQQFDAARTRISAVDKEEAEKSDQRKSDLLRQKVELTLASEKGNPTALVESAAQINQRTPELDLALVQLMMRLGDANSPDKDDWQENATQLTKLMEQSHGRYWGRLAELVIIGGDGNTSGGGTTSSTNLDILVRVGDEAWRKGNLDDAVKAFENAYQQASNDGASDLALTLGMKTAKIFEQQKKFQEAGQQLIDVSLVSPELENASVAHLTGCWNLAKLAAKDAELAAKYVNHLQTHIETWPDKKTNGQARLWLGRYQNSQRQWSDALETLIGTREDSRHLTDAAVLLGFVIDKRMNELKSQDQSTSSIAGQYFQRLMTKMEKAGIGPSDRWTQSTRALLLTTAKVALTQGVGDSVAISQLLRRAISESDDIDDQWRYGATGWLIVAMAGRQETLAEAIEILEQLDGAGEPALAACFTAIENAKTTGDAEQLTALKLKFIELALAKTGLDEATRNRWMGRKSKLLVESGRGTEAISMLESLVEENPRRADLRIQLARALSATAGKAEQAISQWRIISAGVKSQSDNWFEAKYNIIQLMANEGQKDEALKLLEYIQIPPGWSQSKLKAEFDQLLLDLKK